MPQPSLARNFFEQIRCAQDPVAFIRGLACSTPPTYETDWLDFKQQPTVYQNGQLLPANLTDAKWREMWIEVLAGFANNQGGVVVWGIDARKDPATNVDAACGEVPVNNPAGLKSRLIELQRQATDPPLGNVEIETYELPTAPGTGFVVCYVPEGPFKPYRAEDGRKSRYIFRAGDQLVAMSRSMLQSLFYPKVKAAFCAQAALTWELDRPTTTARMTCEVLLVNNGPATAKDTSVLIRPHFDGGGTAPQFGTSNFWSTNQLEGVKEYQASRPIHPVFPVRLFSVVWVVNAEPSDASEWSKVVPSCQAPYFELAIFSEHQDRQDIRIEFDTDEMHKNSQYVVKAWPKE